MLLGWQKANSRLTPASPMAGALRLLISVMQYLRVQCIRTGSGMHKDAYLIDLSRPVSCPFRQPGLACSLYEMED